VFVGNGPTKITSQEIVVRCYEHPKPKHIQDKTSVRYIEMQLGFMSILRWTVRNLHSMLMTIGNSDISSI